MDTNLFMAIYKSTVKKLQDYINTFSVIAYGMAGQVACVKKAGMCDISITKDDCRECIEEHRGLKDVFMEDDDE